MKETTNGGVGIIGLLFLVFLVLKLCKVIDWSWWWVTSPLWITAGIGILIALIGAIIVAIAQIRENKTKNKEN